MYLWGMNMERRRLNNIIFLTAIIFICVLALVIILLLNSAKGEGFNKETAQQKLNEDYGDISVVLTFLMQFENEDIYINDTSGKMLVDLTTKHIENKQVNNAVNNLLKKKGYIDIAKHGHSIYFTQQAGIGNVDYGVAYSIDGSGKLDIPFLTELVALDKPNWYYFVADYEQWRISQTEEHG